MLQSVAHVAVFCNNHSAQNGRIGVADDQKALAVWSTLWRPTASRRMRSVVDQMLRNSFSEGGAARFPYDNIDPRRHIDASPRDVRRIPTPEAAAVSRLLPV
jgi:hypothetical protein